jgi:hypothetical protein
VQLPIRELLGDAPLLLVLAAVFAAATCLGACDAALPIYIQLMYALSLSRSFNATRLLCAT